MILYVRTDPLARWFAEHADARELESVSDRARLRAALADIAPGGEVSLVMDAALPLAELGAAAQEFSLWAEMRSLPARVVLESSAAVYGSPRPGVTLREIDADSRDPAGKTLLAAETFLAERAERRGYSLVVARFFDLLWPIQGMGLLADLCRCVRDADVSGVRGAGAVRDYLDVRDAVRAVAALSAIGRETPLLAVVNVCSGQPVTVRDLVKEIARAKRPDIEAELLAKLAVDDPAPVWRVGSPGRFQELTGAVPLQTPLATTIGAAWGS